MKRKRKNKEYQAENSQLPLSFDMIYSIKGLYWNISNGCMNPLQRYQCGVYLCLLLGYDTGRRIGNLTHRTSLSVDDHCFRTKDVKFYFRESSLYHGTPSFAAGPELRRFVNQLPEPSWNEVLKKMTIRFLTQKSKGVYLITPTKPAAFGRTTIEEEWFLEKMFLWSIWNANDPDDEFFTRRIKEGTRKKLLAADVGIAIKRAAEINGFDPKRFGTHSMRRGFATISAITHVGWKFEEGDHNHGRAGWAPGSKCPKKHYSRADEHGALSYDSSLFTTTDIRELV
jgi:hypothetical protein